MGVRYRELTVWGPFVRSPEERNYGYAVTTPHLEESVHLFERIAEGILGIAVFESKLKTLGEEIQHVTRRTRVLEERVLPKLKAEIKAITQYTGEREREAHFRLKKFKATRHARSLHQRGATGRRSGIIRACQCQPGAPPTLGKVGAALRVPGVASAPR